MIKKTLMVLANHGVDTTALPNKAPYASRFNIRTDIDSYCVTSNGKKIYPYKGKDLVCTQSPKLGNITRYFNYYGREPGKNVVTVKLKSSNQIIAQYTIENYAWVAHRGYMGNLRPLDDRPTSEHTVNERTYTQIEMTTHYTENTNTAFEMACQAGAWGIETDPKLTKDGKLVVFHDLVFGGTSDKGKPYQHKYPCPLSNGAKNVAIYERTLRYINKIRISRVGSKTNKPKYNKVCTFDEYLSICDKYNVHPVIDLSNYCNEPERQATIAKAIVVELNKHPKSKSMVLALPGTYKILGKAMGLKENQWGKLLYSYNLNEENKNTTDALTGKYKALLNDIPLIGRRKLANWEQIKNYDWFK